MVAAVAGMALAFRFIAHRSTSTDRLASDAGHPRESTMFLHVRAALPTILLTLLFALLLAGSPGALAATDINKASLAELEALAGIGTATAGRIVDERKKSPFKDWADVMARVAGIKQARAVKLSEAGLTVNGQPFKATAAVAAAGGDKSKPKKPQDDPATGAAPAKAGADAKPAKS